MAAQRRQSKRRGDLPDDEVEQKYPARGCRPHPRYDLLGALAQSVPFEQADDRHYQVDDRDTAAVDEGFAQGRDDFHDIHVADQSGRQGGDRHDQKRIEPKDETDDDDKAIQ